MESSFDAKGSAPCTINPATNSHASKGNDDKDVATPRIKNLVHTNSALHQE
jgi:hypothetical protein